MLALKWVVDGRGPFTSYKYPSLPRGKRPGKWMTAEDAPAMCETGFHACETITGASLWCPNAREEELWLVELEEVISGTGKSVAQRMRFLKPVPIKDSRATSIAQALMKMGFVITGGPTKLEESC